MTTIAQQQNISLGLTAGGLISGAITAAQLSMGNIGIAIPGLFVTAGLFIANHFNSATKTTAASATTTSSATSIPASWMPGFKVLPTFSQGTSPVAVTLSVTVGNEPSGKIVPTLKIDWNADGTTVETFTPDSQGNVSAAHSYTYAQGNSQYTGHSFYPTFTLVLSDGSTRVFNTGATGRCCEIEVQSPK